MRVSLRIRDGGSWRWIAMRRRWPGCAGRAGIRTLQADIENGDWPCGEQRFAGIVVVNYLHRPLFPRLVDALDEGGVLIYETFMSGNERFGRPSNPEFLLRPDELLDVFGQQLHGGRLRAGRGGAAEAGRAAALVCRQDSRRDKASFARICLASSAMPAGDRSSVAKLGAAAKWV